MKALITGAAGFVGHHIVDRILKDTDWNITIIDRLDESGNLNRLAEIEAAKNPRVRFVFHDLRGAINDQLVAQIGEHDFIIHVAALTSVDRSISDPMAAVMDNVVGTTTILDFARKTGCKRFLNFSTDEVFGPAPSGVRYGEESRYNAGNPYAATKAAAVQLGLSYHNTYGVPVITTHTMNVYGPRQHWEKYIPMTIAKVAAGATVTVHSTPDLKRAGSRFYIDAREVADAVMFLLANGNPGDKYNIVGAEETDNLSLAQKISQVMGRDLIYSMIDAHSQRPGHDLRYALAGEKMAAMGWAPRKSLEQSLEETVKWTMENPKWMAGLKLSGGDG